MFTFFDNQWVLILSLTAALFRVYLEIIGYDFNALPLTKGLLRNSNDAHKFHRIGLYFSMGYILFCAPYLMIMLRPV